MMDHVRPKSFELGGSLGDNELRVSYTSDDNAHMMEVSTGDSKRSYSREQVTVDEIPVGSLYTVVTLPSTRDERRLLFSVLVPPVRGQGRFELATVGFESTDRSTSSFVNRDGPLTTYATVELRGTVSW